MDTTVVVLIVVVIVLVVALAIGGFMLAKARRSQQLQERHGPEYERSLTETGGDRRAAEAQLSEREARRKKLDVRDLSAEERQHFGASWTQIQQGFVDEPVRAVREADVLVVEIMRTRGFPTDDADRRTDDIAVDHPEIAQRYRDARAVRDATARGPVDTEAQRHAVTSYRDLVEALLDGDHSPTTNRHAKEQTR